MSHQYKDKEDRKMRKYKIHMLHLEKLAKTGILADTGVDKCKDSDGKLRCEKSFFCYGYYDKLTYIEERSDNRFTYEHMFSVKYPYKQAKQSINADQLFTLLEPEEEIEQGKNPFVEQNENMPFLGVFLITIDVLSKEGGAEKAVEFHSAVIGHRARLKAMLEEVCQNSDDIRKIYYSPNCADLCIVLRTGSLKKIYQLKRSLGRYIAENGFAGRQTMGVTLYIASEFAESDKGILCNESVKRENANHQIEIRLQCSKEVAAQFQQWLEGIGQSLFGMTGKGDYTFKLDYSYFSMIYPLYVDMKLGDYRMSEASEYKLEPAFIAILEKCKFFYERWYLHTEVAGEVGEDSNKSSDSANGLWCKKRSDICQAMHKAVKELHNRVNELESCRYDENERGSIAFPKQRFMEQFRMVKDLLYTYENLWYDENNISEGRVFYAQMAALLEGIDQQVGIIRKVIKYSKMTNTISGSRLRLINNDLIRNMNDMIAGINNFNKLIQAVNQNLRNVPNYEMQSKVNVEKYLYAYTMYLMELCNKYYKNQIGDEKENERIFPMVTISMNGQKIYALSLFRKLRDSENDESGLSIFLVHCPNYQRFANAYHVLPMISHEISHCFRYEEREMRNKFILKLMAQGITEEVMDEFLGEGYLKYGQSVKSQYVNFIYDVIWKELKNYLEASLEERLPYIHLNNMDKVCMKEMWACFGVSEPHKLDTGKLWEICRANFLKLFTHCHITYVRPEDLEKEPVEYVADGLPNLLIDVLSKDRERLEQWKQVMDSGEICSVLRELPVLTDMKEIISLCNCEHFAVSIQAIEKGLEIFARRVWKGFFADVDSDIDGCLEKDVLDCMALISRKIGAGEEQRPNIELIKRTFDMDEEMSFRLDRYLSETIALIREIRQRWLVYGKEIVAAPEEMQIESVQKMHKRLHDEYNRAIEELEENDWIVTKKTQELYASLGIINNHPEQFVKRLQKTVSNIDSSYLETILRDRMRLYSEVFADLGMCKIFDFTPFGYYAYTIHLFTKERELPQTPGYDMTEERMKLVIFTLWGGIENVKSKSRELKEDIEHYEETVREYERRVNEEGEGGKELQMHESMLTWMKTIYNEMCFEASAQTYDFILNYLKEIYVDTGKMDFLRESIDPVIMRIGCYYNQFIESVGNEAIKNELMDVQNEFVLRYYGKMQDACARVADLEIDSEANSISFVEQYNRQFMQWRMEGEG